MEPEIIDYLNDPPDEATLKQLRTALDCPVIEMVRTKEAPYKENSLDTASEEELIGAIARFPILLERPIVVNGSRAAIGRPPENVIDIL
jgi:arsenate reductase|tara:strand:- start:1514 stop:1780 length:267 start_codon:yes stop_codon:yes gene_type:complete